MTDSDRTLTLCFRRSVFLLAGCLLLHPHPHARGALRITRGQHRLLRSAAGKGKHGSPHSTPYMPPPPTPHPHPHPCSQNQGMSLLYRVRISLPRSCSLSLSLSLSLFLSFSLSLSLSLSLYFSFSLSVCFISYKICPLVFSNISLPQN